MNEKLDTVISEEPAKGMSKLAVGPGSAAWLTGNMLRTKIAWVVLIDTVNTFRGEVDCPVSASSIVRLAADRGTLTVVTKDRLYLWSHNTKSWCDTALIEERR